MKLFKYLTCILFLAAIMLSTVPVNAKDAEGEDKPAKKKKEKKKKEGGEKKNKKEEGGEEKKKKAKGKKSGKGGAMAQFKELKLKEGQKDKIQTILQETKDAKKDLAVKKKELQAKAKAAKEKEDKEAGKTIRKEMSELKKQGTELDKEQDRKILAVLDNKQKAKWNGLKAYKVLLAHLKKAQLSEEQKVQVKDICMSSGDAIDGDNVKQSVEKLMKKVKADVLDENQKKLFEKKPKEDKAEGEKKKGKKKKEGAGEKKKKGKKKKKKEDGDPEK